MVFEDDLNKEQNKKGRFGWLLKLIFFLCVLMVIALGALSMMGGSRDSLRGSVEQFLSAATGMRVEIGVLNNMSFFPSFSGDMEDIAFRSFDSSDDKLAEIEELSFSMSFWNVIFATGKMDNLRVEELSAKRGVWAPRELKIRRIELSDKGYENKPALTAEGTYGEEILSFHLLMQSYKKLFGDHSYRIGDNGDFSFNVGDFEIEGTISPAVLGGFDFDLSKIGAPEKAMYGKASLIKRAAGKLAFDAELLSGKTKIDIDLDIKDGISGSIYSPSLDLVDIGGEQGIGALISYIIDLSSDPDAPSEDVNIKKGDLDIEINFPRIQGNGTVLGNLRFDIKTDDDLMRISGFDGAFSGAKLSGSMEIADSEEEATLDLKFNMAGWQYAQIQKALFNRENVSGTADISIEASGKGKTYEDLINSLNGNAILVGGQGEFASAALNIWGAGLINALLPNISQDDATRLNCVVAAFKIEDGIADAHTVFMDTKRLTMVGKGEINIPEASIDLKIVPEAKDTALLDVTPSVRIKGPITSPDIGADTGSVIGKIGGLLLGAVNPALLIVSLTDMGVDEDHPCRKFFGNEEGAAKE
jgi:hypothetical protein